MKKVKRRKVAYRKRTQNRFSMILVTAVVFLVTVAVLMSGVELKRRYREYDAREVELTRQIEAEEKRAEEIEEFRKKTQTKRYVEEVAKEKLGLVYEGEILFQEER